MASAESRREDLERVLPLVEDRVESMNETQLRTTLSDARKELSELRSRLAAADGMVDFLVERVALYEMAYTPAVTVPETAAYANVPPAAAMFLGRSSVLERRKLKAPDTLIASLTAALDAVPGTDSGSVADTAAPSTTAGDKALCFAVDEAGAPCRMRRARGARYCFAHLPFDPAQAFDFCRHTDAATGKMCAVPVPRSVAPLACAQHRAAVATAIAARLAGDEGTSLRIQIQSPQPYAPTATPTLVAAAGFLGAVPMQDSGESPTKRQRTLDQ
eukprot:Amastigsp_a677400_7.p1 type:complete len:274 gc:universal Amastigsp_a677400_7:199-1020(+)